jgi:hypothetical protein
MKQVFAAAYFQTKALYCTYTVEKPAETQTSIRLASCPSVRFFISSILMIFMS